MSCPCFHSGMKVRNFTSSDVVIVTVNSRLWLQTVAKMRVDQVSIASKIVVKPIKLRFDVQSELPHELFYVQTTAVAEDLLVAPGIPWWIIVLAIIIGILLLALLVWCLYKVCASEDFSQTTKCTITYVINQHKS